MEGRIRRSCGSGDWHTSHVQPIIGTPCDVPLPRKVTSACKTPNDSIRGMSHSAGARFDRLVWIMHTLRGPDGCPWDREQTLASLRPFVLEETCELLDALDDGDMPALKEELGDFLFEAVFLAELCAEAGHFTIADSIQAVVDKLIRRHPHVFTADGEPLPKNTVITAGGVKAQWDEIKKTEQATAGKPAKTTLGGIPRSLPALLRADQLSRKAA